jgi:hypothetical protein
MVRRVSSWGFALRALNVASLQDDQNAARSWSGWRTAWDAGDGCGWHARSQQALGVTDGADAGASPSFHDEPPLPS